MAASDRVPQLSPVEARPSTTDTTLLPTTTDWLAGSSAAICHLRGQIRRVAPYFRTALLIGERGSGEEAAAQALYQLSPVNDRPFTTLTPAEVESLFDTTNASDPLAAHGLLYVPRPESLPRTAQIALLRLVRKRGPHTPRIVAFAEHGLRPLVSSGGFSAELADSLGSLRITIPPLRDRREDIPALLTLIVQNLAAQSGTPPPQLAPDLLEAAAKHPWYGNLNQLHSVAEGLMERTASLVLHALDLQAVLDATPQPPQRDRREIRMMRLDDVIQEHIRAVLFACNGNKLRTAEVLGISRSTLYRMLDSPAPHALESIEPTNLGMTG
jgi:DNA-binding NtrC family response regulator